MCQLFGFTFILTVAALSYVMNMCPEVLYPDTEEPTGKGLELIPGGVEGYLKVQEEAPVSVYDEEAKRYNFGRFKKPFKNAATHKLNPAQYLTQHKEWHWTALFAQDAIIGVATLQFGYVSHAIAYHYNVTTDEFEKQKTEILLAGLPLGAKHFTEDGAPSSVVNGCSKFNFMSEMSQCYVPDTSAAVVSVNTTFPSGRFEMEYEMDLSSDESLNFVYPIGKNRPSIVSKMSGAPAKGWFKREADTVPTHITGLGMIDWTRSLAARYTVWNWAAFSFVDAKTSSRVGIQLSAGVYEDPEGRGVESVLNIDGKMTAIDKKFIFTKPTEERLLIDTWKVASEDGDIQYTFTPRESVGGAFHLYILDGNLQHMVGTATGTITHKGVTYEFKKVPAVLEEHEALW
eukprot:TRINITY_DN395_c0_g2_i5.p1 TRINITY_DN395_c0_g2~~TRINITY_DN395_c0_g2_i5.p1  ORF type:complete len:401 (+),score=128.01 TRINITY_DN395_c0_g2_i5:48-1250(+)